MQGSGRSSPGTSGWGRDFPLGRWQRWGKKGLGWTITHVFRGWGPGQQERPGCYSAGLGGLGQLSLCPFFPHAMPGL